MGPRWAQAGSAGGRAEARGRATPRARPRAEQRRGGRTCSSFRYECVPARPMDLTTVLALPAREGGEEAGERQRERERRGVARGTRDGEKNGTTNGRRGNPAKLHAPSFSALPSILREDISRKG